MSARPLCLPQATHTLHRSPPPRPPPRVEAFVHWLKFYKSSTGIINAFGFDGAAQSKEYAEKIIEETHASWKALVERQGSQAVLG